MQYTPTCFYSIVTWNMTVNWWHNNIRWLCFYIKYSSSKAQKHVLTWLVAVADRLKDQNSVFWWLFPVALVWCLCYNLVLGLQILDKTQLWFIYFVMVIVMRSKWHPMVAVCKFLLSDLGRKVDKPIGWHDICSTLNWWDCAVLWRSGNVW